MGKMEKKDEFVKRIRKQSWHEKYKKSKISNKIRKKYGYEKEVWKKKQNHVTNIRTDN
jgi:hypothetical protein